MVPRQVWGLSQKQEGSGSFCFLRRLRGTNSLERYLSSQWPDCFLFSLLFFCEEEDVTVTFYNSSFDPSHETRLLCSVCMSIKYRFFNSTVSLQEEATFSTAEEIGRGAIVEIYWPSSTINRLRTLRPSAYSPWTLTVNRNVCNQYQCNEQSPFTLWGSAQPKHMSKHSRNIGEEEALPPPLPPPTQC